MTHQDIWIQHEAMNSLNAKFRWKDSTEHDEMMKQISGKWLT